MRRSLIYSTVFLLAVVGAVLFGRAELRQAYAAVQKQRLPPARKFIESTVTKPSSTTSTAILPKAINLAVPFLVQAPTQNWAMPFQEACEEAALLMADAYLSQVVGSWTARDLEKKILDLIAFEEANGYPPDMTAAQTKAAGQGYFQSRQLEVLDRPSAKQIKQILSEGYPVIVPADGKALKNPNFRNGGPRYHMLVIKGYLPDGRWIVNDPGTRNGADYFYPQARLMNAIHDWNGGQVAQGIPRVLVMRIK